MDCFHERGACWVGECAVAPMRVPGVCVTADGIGGVGKSLKGFVEPFAEDGIGG